MPQVHGCAVPTAIAVALTHELDVSPHAAQLGVDPALGKDGWHRFHEWCVRGVWWSLAGYDSAAHRDEPPQVADRGLCVVGVQSVGDRAAHGVASNAVLVLRARRSRHRLLRRHAASTHSQHDQRRGPCVGGCV